ncbi:HAD-IIIC family phosphatase [Clostridium aminobutyricum]|uniref:HAD family hydrolase n=1 Tax=Clostridium aminobutyricum TaxID=33953 RepID=A0A939DA69_CLOAM|nr:HAD-IIIC family phosphatase [Clostridium aminobutyricum]MBN7774061.1 HAD family hydrolase [Clostridium aminobutyricum]
MKFTELRKNLKKDYSTFRTVKMAIVADWSVPMLAQAIRGYGYEFGLDIHIYEAAYDQMEVELLDETSELYRFQPNYILIFPCIEKFQEKFYNTSEGERAEVVEHQIFRIRQLCKQANKHADSNVLICNYCEIDDGIYGNFAGSYKKSLLYSTRKMNIELGDIAAEENCYLVDICTLQNLLGRANMVDNRLYYISKTVFSMDTLVLIAKQICDVISVLLGKIKKCLITDLDNTLWGGIIGDDGLEGIQIGELGIGKVFSDLQLWIKELSRRGIAIAICSKNNQDTAMQPFLQHPDMILRPEDISVFVANWKDKATNIKKIRDILNIGLDSIVFIDDNPFERELVQTLLPEVAVPDLPKEPTEYAAYLKSLNLFETVQLSDVDRERTKQYREEAKRVVMRDTMTSLEAYLRDLEMVAEVKSFDPFSIPRIAQLTQRSNQFNLRTKRYSENELQVMLKHSEQFLTMAVTVQDRFGDYGIIGVVILEKISEDTLFIDTLLMSCRVLKRTVEEFLFNEMVRLAQGKGFLKLEGEYIPTNKNAMVSGLFKQYGFTEIENEQKSSVSTRWTLCVSEYISKKTFCEKG